MLSDYPVLFMLIYLWPGYCENHLERINMRVDKENKKSMGRGGIRKVRRFQGIIVGKWLHDFGAYL